MIRTNHRPHDAACLSRRALIGGGAALALGGGAALAVGVDPSSAATPASAARDVIDVHHHVLPPAYLQMNGGEVARRSIGYPQVLQWTPEKSLAQMDAAGVRTAVLSMSAPVWFGDKAQSRALAHAANDYVRGLMGQHRGRFACFATLPMPDVEGAISEAQDALAHGAVGVGLLSNYDDKYLGEAAFAPLFAMLDQVGAVVYVHPTNASCCKGLVPDVSPAFLELPFDTTRTIASLLYAGAFARYPRIRFIFAHGGGTIPFLADRLSQWAKARPDLAARMPDGPLPELRRLYFDTASVTNKPAMAAMLAFNGPEQVLFGTDYPYVGLAPQLAELHSDSLGVPALAAIRHGNAERLMPALRRSAI